MSETTGPERMDISGTIGAEIVDMSVTVDMSCLRQGLRL